MCFSKPSGGGVVQTVIPQTQDQLNKANALLSNEKVASTTSEKETKKRTVNTLRVPLKSTTDTSTTGVNTAETTTGLNIPV